MNGLIARKLTTKLLGPLDLAVQPGECVTLSGPSGVGKSLLLRALADLDPHGGELTLDGEFHHRFTPPSWRLKVGLLPAESHWWGEAVGEHFPGPPPPPALFAELGLGVDSLDWHVSRLSSGEKQRLALLRLLAGEPHILLLDEPTANLDPGSASRVEALIKEIQAARNVGVLWVTHDPDQRDRVADRRLSLEGADRLVAMGS